MLYDYVIIGGGLAGLYFGYLLRMATGSFLILEADSHFGGRAYDVRFGPTTVPTGAGVGRYTKDRLLRTLLTELGLPLKTFTVRHAYSPRVRPVDISARFAELRDALDTSNSPDAARVSFRTLARAVWGGDVYQDFLRFNGYRDMEQEDAYETLTHYQIRDNYTPWTAFSVRWNDLTRRLCAAIGAKHLRTRQPVHAITRQPDGSFSVSTPTRTFTTRQVILACPIPVVQHLLPQHGYVFREIGVQPFLRTYVQFDAGSAAIVNAYLSRTTVVSNALQKIIPMDAVRGVYMIAYNDNRNAVTVQTFGAEAIAAMVVREFRIPHPLRVIRLQHCFRAVGTHYYRPLSERFPSRAAFRRLAQAPEPGIRVIGESVSTNQGWVEGALETARAAFFGRK